MLLSNWLVPEFLDSDTKTTQVVSTLHDTYSCLKNIHLELESVFAENFNRCHHNPVSAETIFGVYRQ